MLVTAPGLMVVVDDVPWANAGVAAWKAAHRATASVERCMMCVCCERMVVKGDVW